MMDWFLSDTHAYHANIIKYCNRPWTCPVQMSIDMADNINQKVSRSDTLWHNGDVAFGGVDNVIKFREMINCNDIRLILGNHDTHHMKHDKFRNLFSRIYDMYDVKIGKQHIVLCHYAMRIWNKSHHGTWHLYGHSHGSLPDDPNSLSFDIGVDCHNFQPLNFDDIAKIMSKKTWKPVDHHNHETMG